MAQPRAPRWLLLIHQIPPTPSYLRVKIGRRLQSLGSVPVKNSVYVLPRTDQALEDFQWVRGEIVAGGGDASVCEARFVEGLSDGAVEALFNAAREADYESLVREARRLQAALKPAGRRRGSSRERLASELLKLRKRLGEVAAIDFFGAPGRGAVEGILAAVDGGLRTPAEVSAEVVAKPGEFRGRTWVTRAGVHVDRIASAWLIRRFIDPDARFKFVRGQSYAPEAGELRFDMFDAEFTHEGEDCTFEVLLRRFGLTEPALRHVAEIVHDVDLRDARFSRPEASGLERLVAGIAMRHKDDDARLRDGAAVFEALHEYFERKG
ncbi:MAG TPA: chromate resistance protein ChrB domain-containing protein [Vicinamibacteria bacterium]|nr:chromate resistance protein ChrB domain-containing protein [Vicinamibacteria bacterium]